MRFALVGNPNCGKTTLFNQFTGSNQHVGNFPGVTVSIKTGKIRSRANCTVVDLPGYTPFALTRRTRSWRGISSLTKTRLHHKYC